MAESKLKTPDIPQGSAGVSSPDGGRGVSSAPSDFKAWKEWKEWKEWQEWTEWNSQREHVPETHLMSAVDPPLNPPEEKPAKSVAERWGPENAQTMAEDIPVQPETKYVLSGQPTGWAAMNKVVRDFDEEKVKDCKEDIDTLLVFAGLFSAVLSAFVIVAYPNLQNTPDTPNQMLNVLERIAHQIASYSLSESVLISTATPALVQPDLLLTSSGPSANDIRVNILWFASLLLSLMAASFAILVKQWLREYLAVQNPSPQARLRVRHLRYPQLAIWKVFEIAAILPLLLQLSLGLFFVGMCYFTAEIHSSIGHTTIPLVSGWAAFFFGFTLLPVFITQCPYRTPLLKSISHQWLYAIFVRTEEVSLSKWTASYGFWTFTTIRQLWRFTWKVSKHLVLHMEANDESKAVTSIWSDMDILAAVDAIQSNDELLATTISEILGQMPLSDRPAPLRGFILSVLRNRVQLPEKVWTNTLPFISLAGLSQDAAATIADLIGQYLRPVRTLEASLSHNTGSPISFFVVLLQLYSGPLRRENRISHQGGSSLQVLRRFLHAGGPATCTALTLSIFDPRYSWNVEDAPPHSDHPQVTLFLKLLTNVLDVIEVDLYQSIENLEAILRASLESERAQGFQLQTRQGPHGRRDSVHSPEIPGATNGPPHLWSFYTLSADCRHTAISYLVASMERSLNDYRDGDPKKGGFQQAEEMQRALALMFSLLGDINPLDSMEFLPVGVLESMALILAKSFEYTETTRVVLDGLDLIPYRIFRGDKVKRVIWETPRVIHRNSIPADWTARLVNISDVITYALLSTEDRVSILQFLRWCLVGLLSVEGDDSYNASQHQAIWIPIFRCMTGYMAHYTWDENCDTSMSEEIEALASECLKSIWRAESTDARSSWSGDRNEEQYRAWGNTPTPAATIIEDDLIVILARLCPETWKNLRRIRLARDRVAVKRAVETLELEHNEVVLDWLGDVCSPSGDELLVPSRTSSSLSMQPRGHSGRAQW